MGVDADETDTADQGSVLEIACSQLPEEVPNDDEDELVTVETVAEPVSWLVEKSTLVRLSPLETINRDGGSDSRSVLKSLEDAKVLKDSELSSKIDALELPPSVVEETDASLGFIAQEPAAEDESARLNEETSAEYIQEPVDEPSRLIELETTSDVARVADETGETGVLAVPGSEMTSQEYSVSPLIE